MKSGYRQYWIVNGDNVTPFFGKKQEAIRRAKDGYAWATGQTGASWWIDNRDKSVRQMIGMFCEQTDKIL